MALDFVDASSHNVDFATSPKSFSGAKSITTRINIDIKDNYQRLFTIRNAGGDHVVTMDIQFNDPGYRFQALEGLTTGNVAKYKNITHSINTWYTFAFSYDGSGTLGEIAVKLYQDGVELTGTGGTINGSGSLRTTDGPWEIGDHWDGTLGVDGQMAEFGLYDRELSASEVLMIHKAGTPAIIPNGLVFHVPMVNDTRCLRTGIVGTDNTGGPAPHPPVIQPSDQILLPPSGPRILSVSTDDIVPDTEDPWNVTGARFGAR